MTHHGPSMTPFPQYSPAQYKYHPCSLSQSQSPYTPVQDGSSTGAKVSALVGQTGPCIWGGSGGQGGHGSNTTSHAQASACAETGC